MATLIVVVLPCCVNSIRTSLLLVYNIHLHLLQVPQWSTARLVSFNADAVSLPSMWMLL